MNKIIYGIDLSTQEARPSDEEDYDWKIIWTGSSQSQENQKLRPISKIRP
jgi:hypothetical protein